AGPGSAGKTGTAQVGDGTRTSGWFAGYFPLDRPRFAIVVLAENAESGGKTAAPLFREIARAIIEQGGLP
ncbi:penicillin-binding transpeptidase domain-containing protein, partial [Desulforudis sp. 1190]